jgi:hypothetical protein
MSESIRRSTLIVSCALAFLVIGCTIIETPQILRVALGITIIFVLPGLVALSAAGQSLQLSWIEIALGSLAISVATSICVAMLLAATPIGLGRASFAIVLGGITMSGSIIAWARM